MTSIADQIVDPLAEAGDEEGAKDGAAAAAAPAISLPAAGERELRLDLFRGIALWLIFIDHLPPNILTWLTLRNYGFSDATEIFIFISGYTAAFVYGRAMQEAGFVVATARILRRVWQIYVAHVFLFTIFLAEISYVATRFENPLYTEEMGIMDFLKQPDVTIVQALLLRFRPVNMDVLPLYIVLMLFLPLILWLMKWKADVALALSVLLYALTWHYDWYLPAYPNGFWAFNPFAWQLLFVFGAWCALGGARADVARSCRHRSRCGFVSPIWSRVLRHADLVRAAARSPDAAHRSSSGCIRSTRPISTCCASRISWRSRRSPFASCPGTGRG